MSKKTEEKQEKKPAAKPAAKPKKTKRDRFIESTEARVTKLLNQMTLVGNLNDKNKFEFKEEDLQKIEAAVSESFEQLKQRFKNGDVKAEGFKL